MRQPRAPDPAAPWSLPGGDADLAALALCRWLRHGRVGGATDALRWRGWLRRRAERAPGPAGADHGAATRLALRLSPDARVLDLERA